MCEQSGDQKGLSEMSKQSPEVASSYQEVIHGLGKLYTMKVRNV